MFSRASHQSMLALFLWCLSGLAAASGPIYTGLFSNKAVGGYDPIAYFDQGKPVKGSDAHSVTWQGATWLFSSAENKSRFEASPEQYAPQYGGHCAYGVAKGSLVKGDPTLWAVVDGKLYLNYNADVQKKWNADQANHIQTAMQNWPGLSQ